MRELASEHTWAYLDTPGLTWAHLSATGHHLQLLSCLLVLASMMLRKQVMDRVGDPEETGGVSLKGRSLTHIQVQESLLGGWTKGFWGHLPVNRHENLVSMFFSEELVFPF